MHIIFGDDVAVEELSKKYVVLELDTVKLPEKSDPVTAYCVIETIPIDDLETVDRFLDLHKNLMKNYKKKNWKFCQDALEHLIGKWNAEADTFYTDLQKRVLSFLKKDPGPDWTPVIEK